MSLDRKSCRYPLQKREDENDITRRIIELASQYGRYGYRRITALLHHAGFQINHKRVERIWKEQGLKVPQKQPRKRRLWLNDGSCVRLRPERVNQVWSYDFVEDRLSNGKRLRWLNIIDEYSRKCLFSSPRKSWKPLDIIDILSGLVLFQGTPESLRSDNGSEFTATALIQWLKEVEVAPLYIEPGSPWENGYCESFNGKMRDEFLNGEIFDTLKEAEVLTSLWIQEYNNVRPHSSLGYKPPAPQAIISAA